VRVDRTQARHLTRVEYVHGMKWILIIIAVIVVLYLLNMLRTKR
jgi:hypothetical protein